MRGGDPRPWRAGEPAHDARPAAAAGSTAS